MSFLTQGIWRNPAAPRAEQVDFSCLARRLRAHAERLVSALRGRRKLPARELAPRGC